MRWLCQSVFVDVERHPPCVLDRTSCLNTVSPQNHFRPSKNSFFFQFVHNIFPICVQFVSPPAQLHQATTTPDHNLSRLLCDLGTLSCGIVFTKLCAQKGLGLGLGSGLWLGLWLGLG
jgi:hypothetical protein